MKIDITNNMIHLMITCRDLHVISFLYIPFGINLYFRITIPYSSYHLFVCRKDSQSKKKAILEKKKV